MCRLMRDWNCSMKNKVRVEGFICTNYMHCDTTYFLSHYFKTFLLLPDTSFRNDPWLGHESFQQILPIFRKCGRRSQNPKKYYLTIRNGNSLMCMFRSIAMRLNHILYTYLSNFWLVLACFCNIILSMRRMLLVLYMQIFPNG